MNWIVISRRDGKRTAVRAEYIIDVREFDRYCSVRCQPSKRTDTIFEYEAAAPFDVIMNLIGDVRDKSNDNPAEAQPI